MNDAHFGRMLSCYGRAYHDAMKNNGRSGTKELADNERRKLFRYVRRISKNKITPTSTRSDR